MGKPYYIEFIQKNRFTGAEIKGRREFNLKETRDIVLAGMERCGNYKLIVAGRRKAGQ